MLFHTAVGYNVQINWQDNAHPPSQVPKKGRRLITCQRRSLGIADGGLASVRFVCVCEREKDRGRFSFEFLRTMDDRLSAEEGTAQIVGEHGNEWSLVIWIPSELIMFSKAILSDRLVDLHAQCPPSAPAVYVKHSPETQERESGLIRWWWGSCGEGGSVGWSKERGR